jgi:hypothetical protein
MWSVVFSGVVKLVEQWFDTKKAKQEAEADYLRNQLAGEQDWDMEAMRQARYSLKDEFITLIWFAPLIVAWFEPELAMGWIDFVDKMPMWYQVGLFGILAASFGLRWMYKASAFTVAKNKA